MKMYSIRWPEAGMSLGEVLGRVTRGFCISTFLAASGCVLGGGGLQPPFEWDSTFASPGTSLTITEASRVTIHGQDWILYHIEASGFDPDEPVTLWVRNRYNYQTRSAFLTPEGQVVKHEGNVWGTEGYPRGGAFDIALVSETAGLRAHAKIVPFPIEASGENGCTALAKVLSPSGWIIELTFSGFEPGEEVVLTQQYKGETRETAFNINRIGVYKTLNAYGFPDRGTAVATLSGAKCSVTLNYGVGEDFWEIR